jgi:hypothetical protein
MQPIEDFCVGTADGTRKEARMKKALATLVTVATLGATAVSTPAQAYWRGGGWGGVGAGLAFGLAAGAIFAGAAAASSPYYYGPGYGYGGYGGYYPGYAYGPSYGYYPAYYGGYRSAYYGGYRSAYYGGYYGGGPYAAWGRPYRPYYVRHRYWRPY